MLNLKHKKWELHGRTSEVLDAQNNPTGQLCFQSQIGEVNTPDGSGGFLPFLVSENEIQYGDGLGLEFTSTEQKIKKAGQVLCRSFKFFAQAYVGGQWVNQPHGAPTRTMRSGEVFRNGSWQDDDRKCTGFLSFPNAAYDLYLGLEAGGGSKASIGIRFRAAQSAQIRFQIVLDGLQKLPTDWEWIWARFHPSKGKEDRKVGIRVKDLEWRWDYDEAPYRDVVAENNPDGTKKITIILGPYNYTANEWLNIYPDQWGETAIANTNDDCQQYLEEGDGSGTVLINGQDSDGSIVGQPFGTHEGMGLRFQNVTIAANPTSVDSGTQIEYDCTVVFSSTFNITVAGLEGDIAVWDDSPVHGPDSETATAATASFAQPAQGNDKLFNGANFQASVKEVLDTAWTSGFDMGFQVGFEGDASNGLGIQIEDYGTTGGGTAAARLTIVYTPSGAPPAGMAGAMTTNTGYWGW